MGTMHDAFKGLPASAGFGSSQKRRNGFVPRNYAEESEKLVASVGLLEPYAALIEGAKDLGLRLGDEALPHDEIARPRAEVGAALASDFGAPEEDFAEMVSAMERLVVFRVWEGSQVVGYAVLAKASGLRPLPEGFDLDEWGVWGALVVGGSVSILA